MNKKQSLVTPPDIETRRKLAATKYVLYVLVNALMEHINDRYTEAELDAEILWSLSSHTRPPSSARRIADQLVELAMERYE